MVVPDDLGQTKICDLDPANATRPDASDELALVDLVLIAGLFRLGVLGRNNGYRLKENVLRLDVTVVGC